MDFNQAPWWRTDLYEVESATGAIDPLDPELFGPQGAALVSLWNDGRTQQGWGREEFMARYLKQEFLPHRILYGYSKQRWNYAWVMRASKLVCIDIDGKNGGLEYAVQLGHLPPTAAETSKSGNGYHLFYLTDDSWDEKDGFGAYLDHIGFVTGVDIRGVGCVYHYPTQRWNGRPPVALPDHLKQSLQAKRQKQLNIQSVITKTLELDPEEILMLHAELLAELNKPITTGKRNTTLFAIGSKMKLAEVPDWQATLMDRANGIGLDIDEAAKLVENIEKYGE